MHIHDVGAGPKVEEELTQVRLRADGEVDTFICEDPFDGEELGRLDDGGDFEAEVRGRDRYRPESHFHSLEGASDRSGIG